MLSAFAMVAGASFLGLWSFKNVDYSDQLWWRVMADADAGRALRAGVGAGVLLMGFGVWRMIATPATPPVIGEDDPDFTRVRAILATAQDSLPEANLALLGDKRFLFSESGESFMMFGVRGRSWIALGGPIGLIEEGDTITIDVAAHELRLEVDAGTLATRRAAWRAPAPHYNGGVWAKYAALVSSASDGAITTGKRLKRALDTAAER